MDETLIEVLKLMKELGPTAIIMVTMAFTIYLWSKTNNSSVQADARIRIAQSEMSMSQQSRLSKIEDERVKLTALVGKLESQLVDLTGRVDSINMELVETRAQRDTLKQEAAQLKEEVFHLKQKLEASEGLNIQLVKENATFAQQLDAMQNELTALQTKLQKQ